jgi:hypothetical protein
MSTLYSYRFTRPIKVTQHAHQRMEERAVSEALLLDLIETGDVRHKDESRIRLARYYEDRADNLICAAAVLEQNIVIKTLMHHFPWEEP